jgi:hypothetical protein
MQTLHPEANDTQIRAIDLGLYQRLVSLQNNFRGRTPRCLLLAFILLLGATILDQALLKNGGYFGGALMLVMWAFFIAFAVAAFVFKNGDETLSVIEPRRAFVYDAQLFMIVAVFCLLLLLFGYTIADLLVVLIGCAVVYFPFISLFHLSAAGRLRKLKQSADPKQWRLIVENYARYRTAAARLVPADRIRGQAPEEFAHPTQSAAKAKRLKGRIAAGSVASVMLFVLGAIGLAAHQFAEAYYYMALVAGALILFWIWTIWRWRDKPSAEPLPDLKVAEELYDFHTAPNVEHVLRVDPRPPILYLRSFQDDQAFRLFERSLARFNGLGPLIALGSPGDAGQPRGGYYSYVSSDQWKDRITEYMQRARIIILVPAVTEGVDWEIATIKNLGFLEKTALVFPHGLLERKRRFEIVREAVADRLPAINALNIEDSVILHFFVPHSITNIFLAGYGRTAVGRFELPLALSLAASDSYSTEEMQSLIRYRASPANTPSFHTPGPWG